MNCLHGATVLFSRTLVIDKCQQCGGFLVWCENPKHDTDRHWHYTDSASDAATMAYDGGGGKPNLYGIQRPKVEEYRGADSD